MAKFCGLAVGYREGVPNNFQEVISQSYHELKSLGLADSSDSNNEIGNWLSRSVPQSGIRRRKSAVELSSHRYPSGIVYDEQNKLRRNGANTTISLFAINKRTQFHAASVSLIVKSATRSVIIQILANDSPHRLAHCIVYAAHLRRVVANETIQTLIADHTYIKNSHVLITKAIQTNRLVRPVIRHRTNEYSTGLLKEYWVQLMPLNERSSLEVCALNFDIMGVTYRGPAARRAHRRAATARMSSVAERFQPIQSASQTRWTSQILAEINSLPSSRFDLNELAIVQPTNAKVDCNDDISSVLSADSIKPVQLSSQMIAAGPLESEGNVHATRRVDAIGEGIFSKSDQRSLGAQDCVRTASLSTRTLSASSVEESEQNVTETVEHRASSSNHGIECTSSFEIIAEPSSRNVQKESTVVVTVSPKTTPISPRKLPSSLSRLCSLLPGRRSKHERVSRNGDEATTAHYNSLLNYATKGSSILHCTMAKMRTESRQSDSIIHLSKTIYDNDLFSDQGSANLDKTVRLYKRPTMNSNGEDTQMRNVLSSSCFKQWRSLDNCRPGSSTRQSHENETTLALKKWKHKLMQLIVLCVLARVFVRPST
ncbi:unnamed protein product [Toxocara canis]|uniref:Protein kinase domain-containing protein n=1 Tax=Toxocara canis TaxID=6265 RepID=A0A183V1B7_TOXCA|nr:unnamed protein product [Toxocara canis]